MYHLLVSFQTQLTRNTVKSVTLTAFLSRKADGVFRLPSIRGWWVRIALRKTCGKLKILLDIAMRACILGNKNRRALGKVLKEATGFFW